MQNVKVTNLQDLAELATPVHATTRAQTPAKLIISGEHSVLYNQPALAVAINKYTTCKISLNSNSDFKFSLSDLGYNHTQTYSALLKLTQKLRHAYKEFLNGNCNIRTVIQKPQELIEYTLCVMLENLQFKLAKGLKLEMNSSIPIGCGMGSSAAAVVSTIYALSKLFAADLSKTKILSLAQQVENLQHGKSSGLDLHLVANGGCVFFDNGLVQDRELSALPMYIVNTGQPQSTTGECVSMVAAHFASSDLGLQFGQVTRAIDNAITQNDLLGLQAGIKQNHRLLQQIGIVPAKVANFIADVEATGAAAKICGAGAIAGDNGGVVLVITAQNLDQLAAKHSYTMQKITVDNYGTRII